MGLVIRDLSYSTVAGAPSPAASGTSISVSAGHGARFPTAPFYAYAVPSGQLPTLDNAEKVLVTAKAVDTFTIERAQGNTSAQSIATGWSFYESAFDTVVQLGTADLYYNVKRYGAKGDGSTNDTTAITAAIDAAATAGGGSVFFPAGTYMSNKLTLKTGVRLLGDGTLNTVLKLRDSQNTALITSNGFSTADAAAGIYAFGLEAITFDGNKANQSSNGDTALVQVYGYGYRVNNIVIRNAIGLGFYSNWGSSAARPGPDGLSMEARVDGVEIIGDDGADESGFYWMGPHDSMIRGVITQHMGPNGYGIRVGARAHGTVFEACHPWGNDADLAWWIEANGVTLSPSCTGEGGTAAVIWLDGDIANIFGYYYYAGGAGTTGIKVGSSVSDVTVRAKLWGFTTPLDLGSNDGGDNVWDLHVDGGSVSGTLAASSILRLSTGKTKRLDLGLPRHSNDGFTMAVDTHGSIGGRHYHLDNAVTEDIQAPFRVPVPEDYKPGTQMSLKFRFSSTAASNNVYFYVYADASSGDDSDFVTLKNGAVAVAAPGSTNVRGVGTIPLTDGNPSLGQDIEINLSRIGGDALDTNTGQVSIWSWWIEYTAIQ